MKSPPAHLRPRSSAGFTLIEALFLIIILGIGGAGIGLALTSMAHAPKQNNVDLTIESSLIDKMEYLHSLPFATLAADVGASTSSFTDTPVIEGTTMTRSVSIVYIVATTGAVAGSATHLLQITVTIGAKSLTTLVNQP